MINLNSLKRVLSHLHVRGQVPCATNPRISSASCSIKSFPLVLSPWTDFLNSRIFPTCTPACGKDSAVQLDIHRSVPQLSSQKCPRSYESTVYFSSTVSTISSRIAAKATVGENVQYTVSQHCLSAQPTTAMRLFHFKNCSTPLTIAYFLL
jgi:hypothetical protein